MQLTLRRLFKWLGYIALGCYILLAVAFLGIRYWVLPNVDQWREPLQRQLSHILPVELELGEVGAQWRGRHPQISLRDTALRDDKGRLLLQIPALDIEIAWSNLLSGSPRFLELSAEGVDLSVKRDANDRISLVGYELTGGEQGQEPGQEGSRLAYWLSRQGNVRLVNSRITWLDERRNAPPLELRDVALGISQQGDAHIVSIAARPPAVMGEAFEMHARLRLGLEPGQPFSLSDISGLFHVNVADMRPAGWRPWLDVNSALKQGRISWLSWQEVVDGVAGPHVSQVNVEGGVWNPEQGVGVSASEAQFYLAGEWDAVRTVIAGLPPAANETRSVAPTAGNPAAGGDISAPAIRLAMRMKGLSVTSDVFEQPLSFDELSLNAGVGQNAHSGLHVEIDRAQVRNADMDLALQGQWQQLGGGAAGLADLTGEFARAELSAIVRYLPSIVHDEARQWMRHGLLAGRLIDALLQLQGDLVHFPFGDHPERGDFKLGGKVEAAVIDFAPASLIGPPGWPRLEALNGYAQLHKVDLTIRADTMEMRPGDELIALRDVNARIPNIEEDSVLEVEGTGEASASAFIALIRESPLGSLLDDIFEKAEGDGRWQVPIALTIPLTDTAATEVAGEVVFDKAKLLLDPAFPALSDVNGRLAFSHTTLSAQGLKARALGGPVKISGGIGEGEKGMVFEGSLTAKALDSYLEGRLAGTMEGKAPYRLSVQRNPRGAVGVDLVSSLEGLSLNLPPPFAKTAAQRWPLHASWAPGRADSTATVFSAKLAELLELKLLRRGDAKGAKSFFHAGAVGVRGNVEPPAEGLAVDIRAAAIDIDAWRELKNNLASGGQDQGATPALFPPLRDLRLQADKAKLFGVDLDQLTFTARQPEGRRWRVDVSSTQTAGTLFWRESSGRIEGDIEANFQRLAIGEMGPETEAPGQEEEPTYTLDDNLDLPAIRLTVDKLRLYGRDVGSLSAVGLNDAREHRWNLEQLELTSPHASFKGSGVWQLKGPRRGLRLEAAGGFEDLGAYLEQAGFRDLVEGGQGQVEGVIEWRNIPWRFERAGLHGNLRVDLAKGRFVNVGSHSARLLELLSLQSVKRLASMNWNPGGLLKQGFPFDTLQGHIGMEAGILHSENYRVTGPVATIVIAGDVDLPQEKLDLYAVVVPNLDVSGAAIAAGIAVNPIVGVGAFLTQWLLKSPMSKAMTVEYRVRGGFEEPEIEAIESQAGKG